MVERIKNYLVYIFSNFSKSTHQMYAKKLHTLRLWQKNCTPSGFYGKKIAPFWAASLSEIAIWCATWTGMQNNCSIIKLYYRVLIISIAASWDSFFQRILRPFKKEGTLGRHRKINVSFFQKFDFRPISNSNKSSLPALLTSPMMVLRTKTSLF